MNAAEFLATSIAKVVNQTGELRTKPLGRVRSKVSVSKQKRRAVLIYEDRLARRAELRIQTGCPSRVVRSARKQGWL